MKKHSYLILFAALIFINFIYFISSKELICPNDGSHFALVSAIMEKGTVKINDFVKYTWKIDYCLKDNNYYSDHPPGMSLLSIPFYQEGQLLRELKLDSLLTPHKDAPVVFAMFLPNIAGTLVFLGLFLLGKFFGFDFKTSLLTALLFAFASPAWIESSRFFSHMVSTALVLGTVYLTISLKKFDYAHKDTIIGMAVVLALASITEIQNVLFGIALIFYLIDTRKMDLTDRSQYKEILKCLSMGILVFVLIYAVLPIYNFMAFHVWTLKSNSYCPHFPYERTFLSALSGNAFIGLDRLYTDFLNHRMVYDWHYGIRNVSPGILGLCPLFFLSLAGFFAFFKARRQEALLFLSLILIETAICALHRIVLLRHMTTILPLLFFPIIFIVRKSFELIKTHQNLFKRYGLISLILFLALFSSARVFYVLNTYWGRSLSDPFPYAHQWRAYIFFYGFLAALWGLIQCVKKFQAKMNLWAMAFCGAYSGLWMVYWSKKYYWFVFSSKDPAYFGQDLWSILHGNTNSTIMGGSFFIDHCFFISYLVAPLYALWPDPIMLSYLQIWAFFAGAYVFFLILKKRIDPWVAFLAMVAFTVTPANIGMVRAAFNYESFSILLVFLIFKAWEEKKYRVYLVCCFLLAMLKEQMPLVVSMFGLFSCWKRREGMAKWGMVPLLGGLAVFILEVFVLTPYLRQGLAHHQSFHWSRYTQFGHSPSEILLFLLTHPWNVFQRLISPAIVHWYHDLFDLWGNLAFLSPSILLLGLPLFLKSILSSNHHEHQVLVFYYAAVLTPFIFLAAWNTVSRISGGWRLPVHGAVLALMFLHASSLYFVHNWLLVIPTSMMGDAPIKQRFVDKIPANASVLSSFTTLAPLANRKELYATWCYLSGDYFISQKKFELPASTDYLLLDFAGERLLNSNLKESAPKMAALNFDNRWRLQESIENMALYVKNTSGQKTNRLIETSFQPFPVKTPQDINVENNFQLTGIDFPSVFPQSYRIFPVVLYWKALEHKDIDYKIVVDITSGSKDYYEKYRFLGLKIYPVFLWKKGQYIKESYFHLLPHLPPGRYIIHLAIYNNFTKKYVGRSQYPFTVSP